jgi:tetratricopeptide (TPR) repeat protein
MQRQSRIPPAATAAPAAASAKPGLSTNSQRVRACGGRANFFRLLEEARFAFEGGDFLQALDLCGKAQVYMTGDLPISSRREFFSIVHRSLAALEGFEKELPELLAEVEENPASGETHFAVAYRLHALGHSEEALAEYEQVLRLFDTIPPECQRDCLNNIGWIYFRNGNFREAISWFDLALAVQNPNSPGLDTWILENKALAEAGLRQAVREAEASTCSAPT